MISNENGREVEFMSNQQFQEFLQENKKKVDLAMKEFDKHSKEFDKKIDKLLSLL